MAAKPEPGRDPQMAERTNRLNLVFALSSVGLLLALSLMVWADYDREWKRYQLDFNALEVRSMRAERDAAAGKVDATRRQQLSDLIARADQEAAAGRDEIGKLEAELNRLNGVWYRVDQEYRFTKARIDVARYEYEEAGHKKSGSAGKKKAHLDELEKEWNERRLELEKVIAERDAVAEKLKTLRKTQLEAEEKQKELFGERDRLDQSLLKIEPGLVSFVRNLPILDLANPSLKVNQIVPANLYDDVIFSPTPKVDRCTTCHLGIDKKGHENDPQPYRTHPDFETFLRGPHPIERIGCTACHQGRGRATGFQEAVHTASTREQEKDWGRYTGTKEYDRWHLWDYPMLAKGHTESQCAKCHQGVVEVPKAERLNTGLFLVERYGCFGCHKIKGWEGLRWEGLRKVGPDLSKIASKTDPEWMFRWIKEPKAFRPTRMPQIWDVRIDETEDQKARNNVEVNAVVAYIAGKSAKVPYPAPPTGDAVSGRKTFETVGCLACHRIGPDERGIEGLAGASFRTHGPNLDGTGSKVNPAWLYSWLRNPKAYWHDTKMPNLRLTEKEAADVTAYLMSLTNDDFVSRPRPAMDATVRDTIVLEYLKSLQTVAQAQEKLAGMNDEARTLFLGEKTIGRYGCFGCHETPGFEKASPIGVELTEEGSKLVERLDFGFEEGQIPHNLPAWVHRKLMEPRVFDRGKDKKPDELLRMPKFHFQSEEAEAIVTGVLSFTKEQIPLAAQKQLSADERYVEKGRRLVRTLNCQGCHVIGKGGAVQAVIESQLEAAGGDMLQASALAPPLLYNDKAKIGEGARAQTPWLHSFLRDPSTPIRPWLQIRMPSFDLAEDQLNTITHYFAAQDRVPYPYDPKPTLEPSMVAAGKDLFGRWQCVKCHVVAGKLPNQEPANMAPDLAKVPERLRADWLALWLADPGRIMPGTRMPSNFPTDPQENAYPEVLGGDQKKQIEAVRAYLLTLGKGSAPGAGTIATSR